MVQSGSQWYTERVSMTLEDEQQRKTPTRKDVRVALSLSPELAEELKQIADEEATPLAVLVRRWIVERLRQQRRSNGDG